MINHRNMRKAFLALLTSTAILTGPFSSDAEEQKAFTGIVHNDPSGYRVYANLLGGPGTVLYREAFGPADHTTRHQFLRVGEIPPRSGIGEYRLIDADEVFIITEGEVLVTINGRTGRIMGGSLVPCRMGDTVAIRNIADREASFLWVATCRKKGEYSPVPTGTDVSIRTPQIPCPFAWTPLYFGDKNTPLDSAHGGKGRIFNCYGGLSFDYFETRWGVGALILPPGTSIGYHRHTLLEEMYIVFSGQGRGTLNDKTVEMGPGDAMLQRVGSSHGMYNPGPEDLYLLCTGLSIRDDGRMDNENLMDDLSKR